MKFGDRFSNLLEIKRTTYYSDLTFLIVGLQCLHGVS